MVPVLASLGVDAGADLDMAVNIAVDSKCQYVAVCNAAETLLVDGKAHLIRARETFQDLIRGESIPG